MSEVPLRSITVYHEKEKQGLIVRTFAKSLLDGKVFSDLKWDLIATSSDVTGVRRSKRAEELVDRLSNYSGGAVVTRKQLIEIWKKDVDFLKREYLNWVKPECVNKVKWPPAK
ncbi:rha [Acrasis kona]|uniref:Rha n=1 Tax=Acrasis kona TaxID=1008807 RepID=A0AAW2ZM73_9EUKA